MKRLLLLFPAAGLLWYLWPVSVGIWNIGNMLGTALCLFFLVWGALAPMLKRKAEKTGRLQAYRTGTRILTVLFASGFLWAGMLTAQMYIATSRTAPSNTTAIVLGSQVRGDEPSLDLWARIDAAEKYLKENPQAVCIASGGQGKGENRSEAVVIREKLMERGISAERILLESRSKTTEENLRYSAELLKEHGLSSHVAIVTDEYHQLRASWLAEQKGLTPYAVSAKSPRIILSAMYTRELLALTATLVQGEK